jgi:hypothetical protein
MYEENLIPEKGRAIGMEHCANCGSLEPLEEISDNGLCWACEDDRAFKLPNDFISSLPNPIEHEQ